MTDVVHGENVGIENKYAFHKFVESSSYINYIIGALGMIVSILQIYIPTVYHIFCLNHDQL